MNHTDAVQYWERYGEPIDMANTNDSRAIVLHGLDAEPQRILELGCSAGYMTAVMAAAGHTVTAVEIDPVAAELAAPHAEQVIVGDLDRVDADGAHLLDELAPGSFDTLVAADVLEHLREPTACLRRAVECVTGSGSVVLSIPNIAHGDVRLALLQGRFDYLDHGLLDRTHVQFFTLTSLLAMIREAGLAPVGWQRTVRPIGDTEVGVDENLVEFGKRILADDPEVETYQWIVTCRRAEVAGDAACWPDEPVDTTVDAVLDLMNTPVPHPPPLPPPTPTPVQRIRRLVARVGR